MSGHYSPSPRLTFSQSVSCDNSAVIFSPSHALVSITLACLSCRAPSVRSFLWRYSRGLGSHARPSARPRLLQLQPLSEEKIALSPLGSPPACAAAVGAVGGSGGGRRRRGRGAGWPCLRVAFASVCVSVCVRARLPCLCVRHCSPSLSTSIAVLSTFLSAAHPRRRPRAVGGSSCGGEPGRGIAGWPRCERAGRPGRQAVVRCHQSNCSVPPCRGAASAPPASAHLALILPGCLLALVRFGR